MKVLRIVVDGYGKVIGKQLELTQGLQIIIGPNEQGKSTLRSFIADMLYGQKRNTARRLFDDSNTLREPWQGGVAYGGSLRYELDDGRDIEVVRNFHKDRETVQVYDLSHAKDITNTFEKLRNNEVNFAPEHLGLSKEVFINAATISHLTLEDLGDNDAMHHIREKLLSLADAGDESNSADSVIVRLKERVTAIGQPNARTKPLPAARARLSELQQEQQSAKNLRGELAETEERRAVVLREIDSLTKKRAETDAALSALQRHNDADRLGEAEALLAAVDKLERELSATRPTKSVPVEGVEAAVQMSESIAALRRQHAQTEEELKRQHSALESLRGPDAGAFSAKPEDIPEALEKAYSETLSQIQRAKDGIQERIQAGQGIEARYRQFQDELGQMPDFQRLAGDPVEFLNQLAVSFQAALKDRNENIAARDKLKAEVEERLKAIAEDHELFAEIKNLTDMTREFELRKRMLQEQLRQQGSDLQTLRANHEEAADRIPGLAMLTLFCVLFLGALIGAYVAFEKSPIFIAMGLAGLSILYFGGSLVSSIMRKRELEDQIKEIKKLLGPLGGVEMEEEWEKKEREKEEKKKEASKPEENPAQNLKEEGNTAPEIHEGTETAEVIREGDIEVAEAEDAESITESVEEQSQNLADENDLIDAPANFDEAGDTIEDTAENVEECHSEKETVEEGEGEKVADSGEDDDAELKEEEEEEEDEVQLKAEEEEPVAKLLEASGCMTIRELEARYEKYREAKAEIHVHESELETLETHTRESEEHVPKLLQQLRETFETQLKDKLEGEDDVPEAVKRAISRYQEYRDIKRRGNDARTQYDKLDQEIRHRKQVYEEAVGKQKKVELEIRAYVRERGFDEAAYAELNAAVRGFRARLGELGELHGRVEVLQKAVDDMQTRLAKEGAALESLESEFAGRLNKAGVISLQEWKALSELSRQSEILLGRKTALEEQIRALLGGINIDTLRKRVHSGGMLPLKPMVEEDTLKAQLSELDSSLDACKKEEYALHLQLTERAAAARSMSEIEEEIAAIEKQVAQLAFELEAATYAVAHIEDIARDKHARIAPKLAERASSYLKAITNGAYSELLISRDMTISVRIPQTQRMHENPERSLSKGTVDQIYLALRLSLVQSMSDNGESIPMLLDDPFANYDDDRLLRTMKILAEIAGGNQILLFTCREDVARAAESAKAPVIRL